MMSDLQFDVGGVRLARPFHVQRLGHAAFIVDDQQSCLHFYCDLLGLSLSDSIDFSEMLGCKTPGRDGNVYFLRVASDHHSVVIFPGWSMPPRRMEAGTEHISHLAWQVGTMQQVIEGGRWLTERHERVRPGTRDPAGSNYNSTVFDNNGLPNEIYYGMDQIGWSGISKPFALQSEPDIDLPPIGGAIDPDFPAMRAAIEAGADLRGGLHQRPWPDLHVVVDGVRLPRPFRVVANGPVGLFVEDVDATLRFYRDALGFRLTERITYRDHGCAFLRVATDHHVLALYPIALREALGLGKASICAYHGLRVQNYRQLRAAIGFLRDRGVEIRSIPQALTPGIDHAVLAIAPDGHAVLLHHHIDQIGWDGLARPQAARMVVDADPANWPEALDGQPDSLDGFMFQGPIG
ncbi:VOC family protein [Sphingobium sp. CAP-1]|uniref:VOC family protein n=1 Tax=Sphingobium sp. CAP-1 TaxID=2676077 RepID=UPI0018AD29ED|nr:VOC family protein [Sphingobium sp. CAP-1]